MLTIAARNGQNSWPASLKTSQERMSPTWDAAHFYTSSSSSFGSTKRPTQPVFQNGKLRPSEVTEIIAVLADRD